MHYDTEKRKTFKKDMQFYWFQMPNNYDILRGVIKAYKFIARKLYEWVRDVNTKEAFNFIRRNRAKKMHRFGKLQINKISGFKSYSVSDFYIYARK